MAINWNKTSTPLAPRPTTATSPDTALIRAAVGIETGIPKRPVGESVLDFVNLQGIGSVAPKPPVSELESPLDRFALETEQKRESEPGSSRKERTEKQKEEKKTKEPKEAYQRHPTGPQQWKGGEIGKLEAEIARLKEMLEAERQKVKKLQFDLMAANGEVAEGKRALAREKSTK